MQEIILLLVLAAVCFGAAIPNPQEWGSATSLSSRPQPTYTIVIPCYPSTLDCIPKTITLAAYSEAEATIKARAAAPQDLPSVTRTVLLPTADPTTSTSKKTTSTSTTKKPSVTSTTKKPSSTSTSKLSTSTKKTYYKRQELGSPTRTVLLPTPVPTTSTKSSSSTSKKTSTSTKKTHWIRQVLGSPTRTVLLPTSTPIPTTTSKATSLSGKPPVPTWPWWPTFPIHTVTITSTVGPPTTTEHPNTSRYTSTQEGSTRTISTILTVPIDKRQVLGSPSRTLLYPWPSHTIKPITTTVYVTVTALPPITSDTSDYYSFTSRTPSTTLGVTLDKRQELGSVTRTVLLPTTIYSISDIYITTTKYVTATATATSTKPTTLLISTTTTKLVPTTLVSLSTLTTCTEEPSTWDPWPTTTRVTSSGNGVTSRTATSTLTVPYDKRQEIGGPIPSFTVPESISWVFETPIPTRTYGRRQRVEASPTRTFTYITPTTTP